MTGWLTDWLTELNWLTVTFATTTNLDNYICCYILTADDDDDGVFFGIASAIIEKKVMKNIRKLYDFKRQSTKLDFKRSWK